MLVSGRVHLAGVASIFNFCSILSSLSPPVHPKPIDLTLHFGRVLFFSRPLLTLASRLKRVPLNCSVPPKRSNDLQLSKCNHDLRFILFRIPLCVHIYIYTPYIAFISVYTYIYIFTYIIYIYIYTQYIYMHPWNIHGLKNHQESKKAYQSTIHTFKPFK